MCWHCLDLWHSPASLWSKEAPKRGMTVFSSTQQQGGTRERNHCIFIHTATCSRVNNKYRPVPDLICPSIPSIPDPPCLGLSSLLTTLWLCMDYVQVIQREQCVVKGMCYHKLTEAPTFFPLQALQRPINFGSGRLVLVLRLNSPDVNFYPLDLVILLSCNFIPPHPSLIR